jgi:hypothetical protein
VDGPAAAAATATGAPKAASDLDGGDKWGPAPGNVRGFGAAEEDADDDADAADAADDDDNDDDEEEDAYEDEEDVADVANEPESTATVDVAGRVTLAV